MTIYDRAHPGSSRLVCDPWAVAGQLQHARTLYVSDLDATLLRSDGTLSVASVDHINAAIASGALFTYATARSFSSSRRATASLQLGLPVITYGGTITADPDTGTPLGIRRLNPMLAEQSRAACDGRAGISPIFHTYQDGRDWIRWDPRRETLGTRAFLSTRNADPRLRPITTHDPFAPDAVFYVAILAPRRDLVGLTDNLRSVLAQTAHFLSEDAATPDLSWLEFHHPQATKAHAIQGLRRQVNADRLVVFGDNHNDLPMFELADEAYAVANAVPQVRTSASAVIDSNNDDAVAKWILQDTTRLQATGPDSG